MFDISFSELLVIAIVALVVIGPEKLPKVARTAGAFFGRLQRFVAQVKDEVNRESRFAELQKLQDEVHSSLQQGYVDIERSILPTSAQDGELVEDSVSVKKPRKPRQAKVKEGLPESTLVPSRRRSKVTTKENISATETEQNVISKDATAGNTVTATPVTRRPRKPKPKPASDTPDMFVDEPKP